MFSRIWKDVQYSIRGLLQSPAFTTTSILAIALGIGINTGIFSVVNGLVLRGLPAPNAQALISISQEFQGVRKRSVHGARRMFSMPEYRAYRDGSQTLSGLMAYTMEWTATLNDEQSSEIYGKLVTCNYFDVLEQWPNLGPGFTSANCETESTPVVVLSHDLWTRVFGSDPGLVTKSITLNGKNFAVVGIAPEGLRDTELDKSDFFVPVWTQGVLRPSEDYYSDEQVSWLMLMGRRKYGIGLDQVHADLATIAGRIDAAQPGRRTTITTEQAAPFYMRIARTGVLAVSAIVLAAFGLVLLIACANVANLFLARASGRRKEIAIRMSLGATRRRLIQQLLTESLLVAVMGGMLGSILAVWSFRGLVVSVLSSLPADMSPLTIDTSPDASVLGFAISITLITGILCGLGPAVHASRQDPQTNLKEDSGGSGRTGAWLRSGLVGTQVAVCMVLLIATGLLMRGLHTTHTVDPGFEYEDVAMASFDFRASDRVLNVEVMQQQLIDEIRSLPGVESIASTLKTPLSRGRTQTEFRRPNSDDWNEVDFNEVSSEYFSLLRIPIVSGRGFGPEDLRYPPRTVIITDATARRYWPAENPLEQTVLIGGPNEETPVRIIGIAQDAELSQIGQIDSNYLYLPAVSTSDGKLQLLIRNRLDIAALTASLRAGARELNPGMVVKVSPLEDNLAVWRQLSSLVTGLAGSLAVLAVILACLGVYGVVSYAVSRRKREFGIRLALGANSGDVQRMIVRQIMRPVLIGCMFGIAAAAAVSQVLKSVLFGISTLDPVAFIAALSFLLVVALLAAVLPTRHATHLDPITTLRHE